MITDVGIFYWTSYKIALLVLLEEKSLINPAQNIITAHTVEIFQFGPWWWINRPTYKNASSNLYNTNVQDICSCLILGSVQISALYCHK